MGRFGRHLALVGSVGLLLVWRVGAATAQTETGTSNPRVVEALQLIATGKPQELTLGFLRLEALRDPATVDAIRPYADSRDSRARAACLRALAAIEGPAAVPLLLEKLATDRHPRVRRAALLSLEPLRATQPEATLLAFLKALRDRKSDVRMAAIDIVSRIDEPRAREAMLDRWKRERSRDVRRVLELALRRIGQP